MPAIDLARRDLAADTSPFLSSSQPVQATRPLPSKLRIFTVAFAVILFNSAGNLALAWGMKHVTEVTLDPLGYLRAMLNPFVALGIILLSLWLLTRMALLSWADLSFVLPITGVGYVLAALLGTLFLNESITSIHWAGTFLIFAGTAMVGSTDQQTRGTGEVDP